MANHEINEEQEAVNKALRMIETSDPVHADVYNALFSVLINNDVFLEKLANKMVQQVMISHVMDSTNKDMVMGADQGPVITQLIEKVQEKVDVLNTNQQEIFKKYWSLSGRCTNIAADTDMHTIIQSGNYGCGNNDIANSLKNCPMDKAFVLHVYSSTGSGTDYYIIQEYTAYDASRRILNFYNTESKTWIAREFAFKS